MSSIIRILQNKLLNTQTIRHIQNAGMSQYPKFYAEPIYRKSEIEDLKKNGELSKLAHIPTRAALIDQTSSVFHDRLINKFTNLIMRDGDKMYGRAMVTKTFEYIKRYQLERYHKASEEDKKKIILDPKQVFYKAIENCMPLMYLTPIKRGGVRYQVPMPITEKKARFMSCKWLLAAGENKDKEMRFYQKLAHEMIDAANNTGRVIKQKQDLHKQCEANRAYAHYRWS